RVGAEAQTLDLDRDARRGAGKTIEEDLDFAARGLEQAADDVLGRSRDRQGPREDDGGDVPLVLRRAEVHREGNLLRAEPAHVGDDLPRSDLALGRTWVRLV